MTTTLPPNFTNQLGSDGDRDSCHELMIGSDGQVGFIARENRAEGPAWTRLGVTFPLDVPMPVAEAARITRADQIQIAKAQGLWVLETPDGGTQLLADQGRDRHYRLVRLPMEGDPIARTFGKPVTDDYTVVQMAEVIALLDGIKLSEKWPLETMGVLRNGEQVFISFQSDRQIVRSRRGKTDETQGYFLLSIGLDGLHSNVIGFSAIRPVCKNTLMLAIASAAASVKLQHTPNIGEQMELFVRAFTGVRESSVELMNNLASFEATDTQVQQVIDAAFPLRKAGAKVAAASALLNQIEGDTSLVDLSVLGAAQSQTISKEQVKQMLAQRDEREREIAAYNERMKRARELTFETLYARERADFPDMGGLWLGVNAVGEYADWNRFNTRLSEEEIAYKTVFDGDRLETKQRAVKAAVELMAAGSR